MKKLDRLDFYAPVLDKFILADELQWLIELEYTLFSSMIHSTHTSLLKKT